MFSNNKNLKSQIPDTGYDIWEIAQMELSEKISERINKAILEKLNKYCEKQKLWDLSTTPTSKT